MAHRAALMTASLTWMVFLASGCTSTRIEVDCRLVNEPSQWPLLDGPEYVIHGETEEQEASLAFQEFADMLARGLKQERPDLGRVAIGEPARLVVSLGYNVIDNGTGVRSYPVYGPRFGYIYCGGGVYEHPGYGYVGTETQTIHLGYTHVLMLSVWTPDESKPAGRRVLWEGHAESVSAERSLKAAMPCLVVALVSNYGQSTGDIVHVRMDRDDERVEELCRDRSSATQDAE